MQGTAACLTLTLRHQGGSFLCLTEWKSLWSAAWVFLSGCTFCSTLETTTTTKRIKTCWEKRKLLLRNLKSIWQRNSKWKTKREREYCRRPCCKCKCTFKRPLCWCFGENDLTDNKNVKERINWLNWKSRFRQQERYLHKAEASVLKALRARTNNMTEVTKIRAIFCLFVCLWCSKRESD